jgi:hypothetical protein
MFFLFTRRSTRLRPIRSACRAPGTGLPRHRRHVVERANALRLYDPLFRRRGTSGHAAPPVPLHATRHTRRSPSQPPWLPTPGARSSDRRRALAYRDAGARRRSRPSRRARLRNMSPMTVHVFDARNPGCPLIPRARHDQAHVTPRFVVADHARDLLGLGPGSSLLRSAAQRELAAAFFRSACRRCADRNTSVVAFAAIMVVITRPRYVRARAR